MVRVIIYIEGGGEGQLYDVLFRMAWSHFFQKAGLEGRMPRIVRGGSRNQACHRFKNRVNQPRTGEFPLLLVDSEAPVRPGHSSRQHFERHDSEWEWPDSVGDGQVFMMVQFMETWFVADRQLLRRYFGNRLRENKFKAWPALEDVPKQTIIDALIDATVDCPKTYAKGKVSFEILQDLDPVCVETACPHAKELLDRLRELL